MKFKLLPVILTAACTSVATLFIVARFQQQVPYFSAAAPQRARMAGASVASV